MSMTDTGSSAGTQKPGTSTSVYADVGRIDIRHIRRVDVWRIHHHRNVERPIGLRYGDLRRIERPAAPKRHRPARRRQPDVQIARMDLPAITFSSWAPWG